MRLSAFLP